MSESAPDRRGRKPVREPRPLAAFFVSLGVSALLLAGLLLTDGRVMELRRAKAEARELEMRIAREQKEHARLTAAIEAANREEFPAERVAREELNLVHPEDLVLLYPPGSLSAPKPTPAVSPSPRRRSPSPRG